jgi:anti-anti-sigma regulatory factor
MAFELRTVIVKQLPQTQNEEQAWAFLESFKLSLTADRPRVVLNCASLGTFNRSSLHLLLSCLEEAMKRNGDVKLSSLSETARGALEGTGIGDLFRIFDTDAEAIKSFQRLPLFTVPEQALPAVPSHAEASEGMPLDATENAA